MPPTALFQGLLLGLSIITFVTPYGLKLINIILSTSVSSGGVLMAKSTSAAVARLLCVDSIYVAAATLLSSLLCQSRSKQ